MRFNDKEIAKFGEGIPTIEGLLFHMKPQSKEWSDWYQQSAFKKRMFKLKANLLFYYRVDEEEPLGVIVLENSQIGYEHSYKDIPFAFSVTFKINDKLRDSEKKHIFSCKCQEDVNKWVTALKNASYEHWRSQFVILKTKISMKTGQDPILNYLKNQQNYLEEMSSSPKSTSKKRPTFHSHIENLTNPNNIHQENITVAQLIDI